MMRSALFACAAIGALMIPAMADECGPLKMVASVDMIVERGKALVPVTVAGEQVYFAVSTATPYSGISAHYAESHNFPRRHSDVNFVGIGGEVSNQRTTVPSFAMGGLRNENFDLFVMNEGEGAVPPGARVAQGAFGADLLRPYDVELDFGAGKLNLISRDHCDAMPVYWPSATIAKLPMTVTDQNKITFRMTLDGHDLQTVLATGMPRSTLKQGTAREVFNITDDTPGNVAVRKLSDGTQLYSHRFQSLSVEGLTIANPDLVILPSRADQAIEHRRALHGGIARGPMYFAQQPDITLGLAELRRLHIYIDYHHQMIYFTPAAAK